MYYSDTNIVRTVKMSVLIISCDTCSFKRTHIRQARFLPTLRPVANPGKEVGSSGMEIANALCVVLVDLNS
jgi:hypothetical protein